MYTSMFRKAMLGDTATLNLDFTTGVLDSRLIFTRAAGTATYINSSGYVATATTNEPRFDHDQTTLAPRGLLIEAAATNVCTYSNDFNNVAWTKDGASTGAFNAVVTPGYSSTAPDGSSTVTRIVFNKTGGDFSRISIAATSTAGNHTMSVWMKANTANGAASTQNVGLRIGSSAGVNCVVTTTWQRFTHTYTTASTFQIMLWDNIVGNDETADVFVYGAQMEAGSGASSYIPTGASQVTRNPDYLLSTSSGARTEFSLDDLAAGTSALNAHTVLWTYGRDPNSKREYPASLYARTNANTERIDFRDFSGTTVEVGTQTRTVQAVTVGTASIVKIAVAQSTSAYPSSAINGTSATLTSGVIDSALGLQWVQLCNSSAVASSFNPIWARQLKVYPTALTAAQLQTLTAL